MKENHYDNETFLKHTAASPRPWRGCGRPASGTSWKKLPARFHGQAGAGPGLRVRWHYAMPRSRGPVGAGDRPPEKMLEWARE